MSRPPQASRKSYIQSVERALDILEILARAKRPMRNGEIAKIMNISSATANNLIRTLYMRKYLEQDSDNGYTLGMQSFIVGSAADIWKKLRLISRDDLLDLGSESGATVFLGVLHRHQMIAVDVVKSNSAINIALEQMWLDQCHSTASGKVLLSALTDEEYEDFISSTPLNKLTEHTICDPWILKKELEQIRKDGYSVVRDESVFGVSSIGVPVCGRNWHPVAALGIAFSSYFLNDQYLQRQLTLLNKYRRKLEKKLLS